MSLTHVFMFVLGAFGLASSMGSGCAVTGSPIVDDDCGEAKFLCLNKTIRAGMINGQSDYFELETPEARNDCHAQYIFNFRWADPVRRLSDPDMPPLDNLARAFSPGAEFTYFPHDPPKFMNSFNPWSACGPASEEEGGFWQIRFDAGNKGSSLPTTRYYVGTRLDPAVASSIDDTEITCHITYYDKPKK